LDAVIWRAALVVLLLGSLVLLHHGLTVGFVTGVL